MQQSEESRNRWAISLTVVFSVFIFIGFAFYKGFLSFEGFNTVSKVQTANIVAAEVVPSPVENTKKTFQAAFEEIDKKYQEFKESLSDVFVPFITGIEVYERK